MTRSQAMWRVGIPAVLAATYFLAPQLFFLAFVLVGPQLLCLVVVGAVIFFGVRALSRAGSRPGEDRHLVFTVGTAVAFAVIWLSFPTHSYLSARVGAFLCGAVLTIAFVDVVVAAELTRRVTTTIDPDRAEVLVDEDATMSVGVGGPPLPVTVQLGATRLVVDPSARGTLHIQAGSRGVVPALPVEVRSTGLCGVLGCLRRRSVPLSTPIYVGPRPVVPARPFPQLGGAWGEGSHLPSPNGDVVRGVRDYVPGDRRSLVHWRASARTGRLVVKELEEPFTPVLVMVLDLGSGSPAGEQAAGRAAWYLHEALRRGVKVVLASREATGLRTGPVDSPAEIIRRLASAVVGLRTPVPGRADEAPPPWVTAAGSTTGPSAAVAAAPAPAPAPGQRVLRVGPEGDTWE